jgi:prepilin-type processing-associated H-X9-DG protein
MSESGGPVRLEYSSKSDDPLSPYVWIFFLFLAVFGIIVVDLFGSVFYRSFSPCDSPVVKSQSNLRQIGQAILLYTNENGPGYPNSFGPLLMTEDLTSDVFISPLSSDSPAQGATTRAAVAQLSQGGHCSYVYLGKGLSAKTVTPNIVVAYEKLQSGEAIVLFGDGHVERVFAMAAQKIIADAGAGKFPVTMATH